MNHHTTLLVVLAAGSIVPAAVHSQTPATTVAAPGLVIGYDAAGRVASARTSSGYTLYVNYLTDGTQVIRDRAGGLISRQGDATHGYRILQVSDPTTRIRAVVAQLDEQLRGSANP